MNRKERCYHPELFYHSVQIADGVYRIFSGDIACSDLIVGTKQAALIDTGCGLGDLAGAVRAITQLPLLLFNTHCHVDHTGSNVCFGLPVHMGSQDIPYCSYASSEFFRQTLTGMVPADSPLLQPPYFDKDEFLHRGCGETVACDEGESFDLGGLTLRVYDAPGHSLGGRAYYLEERRILYVGDEAYPCTLLFGYGSASRATHIQTLQKLLSIPFERYVGMHHDEPLTREDMQLALEVAQQVEWEKGIPFPNPLKGGENARLCTLPSRPIPESFLAQLSQGMCIVDRQVVGLILSKENDQ